MPIEGVLPSHDLTRVETVTPQPSKLTSQNCCFETGTLVNRENVVVANFTDESLTLPGATVIGEAEPVSENSVILVNSGEQTVAILPTVPRRKKRNVALYS